jgi:hypothetical protein
MAHLMARVGRRRRLSRLSWWPWLPWLLFGLSLLVWLPIFESLAAQGRAPVDFLAYRRAADALARGEPLYPPPADSQRIWRSFHQLDVDVRAAAARGQGRETLGEALARPQQPGPYVYPPTLALLVEQLQIGPIAFGILLVASVFGFGWLWLEGAGARSAWLWLIVLSWDVHASLSGGNVELLLLFGALLAARLLWDRRPLATAPVIALVVLVKPFYALFFVAFGALQLASRPTAVVTTLRSSTLSVGAALALIALEVARWGERLRAEAVDYLLHALEHQWLVLPVAEQTPMSAWNRAPVQGLVETGLSASAAQLAALGLWLALLAITAWRAVWRAPGTQISFPLAFALAFALLYLGRPVGWGLIYLEIVVLVAVWPDRPRWQRVGLLGAAVALMASHWWALVLTIRGEGLQLLTLQSADRPWETWLILPLSWLLLLRAISPRPLTARPSPASQPA